MMQTLWQDLRYGVRMLLKQPVSVPKTSSLCIFRSLELSVRTLTPLKWRSMLTVKPNVINPLLRTRSIMQERQGAERGVQCLLKIGILARDRYSTPSVCSHQVMISSREKSESPRNQISTSGQRSRTRFTIRLIVSFRETDLTAESLGSGRLPESSQSTRDTDGNSAGVRSVGLPWTSSRSCVRTERRKTIVNARPSTGSLSNYSDVTRGCRCNLSIAGGIKVIVSAFTWADQLLIRRPRTRSGRQMFSLRRQTLARRCNDPAPRVLACIGCAAPLQCARIQDPAPGSGANRRTGY